MLDYLIKLNRHFQIDIKNRSGMTPACMASYFGHMDILNLLLENGADLRAMDTGEQCCYDHMIHQDHIELIEIFYPKMVAFDKERLG